MESFTLKRLVPTDAGALGMVRAGVCGFILCEILLTSFSDLGQLPVTLLRPTGAMQVLPWRFYDLLLTRAGMLMLKWLMVLSLFAATIGCLTSLATKSSSGFRGGTGNDDIVADLSHEDFQTALPRLQNMAAAQSENRVRALTALAAAAEKPDLNTGSPCLFCLNTLGKTTWSSLSPTSSATLSERTLPVLG